jgi:hypothetical protein
MMKGDGDPVDAMRWGVVYQLSVHADKDLYKITSIPIALPGACQSSRFQKKK